MINAITIRLPALRPTKGTTIIDPVLLNLAVALGIGLLIGAERERRKGSGPSRSPAGLRTFAVTSLAGAISALVGGEMLLAVATAGVFALTAVAYWHGRSDDPGLTTEIALTATVLLGGLAMQRPALAGGIGVIIAVLLAARSRLHQFVGRILTEAELHDALIFAAATLVVLPLLPDRAMGPYGALNPRSIWLVVILVMAISAAGYVAVRVLGARFGLPLAGLAAGFISSTATIAAMGGRAAKQSDVMAGAVAGAVLSTVATIIQMALVLGTTSMATLSSLAAPLLCAGLAAVIYGAVFTSLALRQTAEADIQPSACGPPSCSRRRCPSCSSPAPSCRISSAKAVSSSLPPLPDSPIPTPPRSRSPRWSHPESSARRTRSCRFSRGFRPTPSARPSWPPPAADAPLRYA